MSRPATFFFALFLLLPQWGVAQKKTLEPIDTSWYNPGDVNYNLLVAAYLGIDKDVARFLRQGAFINTTTMNGNTPLILAAGGGHLSTVRLLVLHDADINKGDKEGTTPLIKAVKENRPGVLSFLLRSGADPERGDRQGRTPLLFAAAYNLPDLVAILLDGGADPDRADKQGTTPLMAAVYAGNNALARYLTERGAAINRPDKRGFTPLLIAVQHGNREIIRYLLDNGADLRATTVSGYNALLLAVQEKEPDITEILLNADTAGFFHQRSRPNPVSLAVDNNDPVMKETLIDNDFQYKRSLYLYDMHLGGEMLVNHADIMPGVFFSLTEGVTRLSLQTAFLYRAFPAHILWQENDHLFWQYKEYRGVFFAGLGRAFLFNAKESGKKLKYGADLLLSVIYSFGPTYSGSVRKPPTVVSPSPSAGLFLHIGNIGLRAGYTWLDLHTYDLSGNHFSFRIYWIINRKKISRTEKIIPWIKD